MNLRPGLQLRSTACTTEVIVVKAADPTIALWCGGAPMVDRLNTDAAPAELDPQYASGTRVGKRYVLGADVEVLVTKAGAGTLSAGSTVLTEKSATPLPASD